ncbi:MAG: Gfo/Idh/MocA family oxidoreductase [Gemmatimonadaceae bacterium]|nr:Gfo/Idh/MocA family oxidoreductase [Gemmatimonadaceae bacterium]
MPAEGPPIESEVDLAAPKLRLGVAGLSRAFMLMLPAFLRHPRVQLVAAADPRPEARHRFARDYPAPAYASVAELCADDMVQALYIATPHQLHAEHVAMAAAHGKHVLVEKPMALTLDECQKMIDTARSRGVHMIIGHSHSFDRPYQRTRELIASGAFGNVRMITALNFTDYVYRPRRPEELVTGKGGGVVFGQASHQIDIVRLLGGGKVRSVRSATGSWDPRRPTEGAYSAFLTFESGAFASVTYSGYGHFDSDELLGWIGEMGQSREWRPYGAARQLLRQMKDSGDEAALKSTRAYGQAESSPPHATDTAFHNHFGLVIASCDHADLRPVPRGIHIHADERQWFEELPAPFVPRGEVLDELCDAVLLGRSPLHTGEWGMATLEVCLAILRSAAEGRELLLEHQAGIPDSFGAGASGPARLP